MSKRPFGHWDVVSIPSRLAPGLLTLTQRHDDIKPGNILCFVFPLDPIWIIKLTKGPGESPPG